MKKFEAEAAELRNRVVEMGNVAEEMVGLAVDAISAPGRDELIRRVIERESQLDLAQIELDEAAVRLMTVYSPVAGDLRFVMTVSRITAELERIGDHAVNMCEAIQLMVAKSQSPPLTMIIKMGAVVRTMTSDALNAFLQSDAVGAQTSIASDDMVDALNDQVVEELLSDEVVREVVTTTGKDIAGRLAQMLIARSLERIADHTTNICEEIIYMEKGEDIRHARSIARAENNRES